MQPRVSLAIGALVLVVLVIGLSTMAGNGGSPGFDHLYQVSTIDALLEGEYNGTVTIDELGHKGDTGIGTFHRLDGELVMLEGVVYQALATGEVIRASPDQTTPFAAVNRFRTDRSMDLGPFSNLSTLERQLDGLLMSKEHFTMVRVDGTFDYVKVRAPPAQDLPYPRLVDAIAEQRIYELDRVEGTLVGTFSPDAAKGTSVPGWHLHFISADRHSGGHLLEVVSNEPTVVQLDELFSITVKPPEGDSARGTNLSQNLTSYLIVVEKGR